MRSLLATRINQSDVFVRRWVFCIRLGVVVTVVVQEQVITLNSVQPFAVSRKITNMKVTVTVGIT